MCVCVCVCPNTAEVNPQKLGSTESTHRSSQVTGDYFGLRNPRPSGKRAKGRKEYGGKVKEEASHCHIAWVQVPAPPLTRCVTSGRSFNISIPQFPSV